MRSKAMVVGDDDGLHAVPDAEFRQDSGDVGLDGVSARYNSVPISAFDLPLAMTREHQSQVR